MSKVSAVLYEDRIEYRDSEDQELVIDSEGASPMELLLMAVAGCSGLTLESLLERDGYAPDKVKLTVRGIISDKAPRRYTEINVDYDIVCEGLDTNTLEKYLKITERVCPVVQSLNATVHLTYTLNQQTYQ